MLVLVSPAKKLDFESPIKLKETTTPILFKKANDLVKQLQKLSVNDIKKLMKLSDSLSKLNHERYKNFQNKTSPTRPAVFAFNGDTYNGLDIHSFNESELKRAQQKLRILSGLYGILKPFDLIHPYRLEMGTKFSTTTSKNLYEYWMSDITDYLNDILVKEKIMVNCASGEYFKAIDSKKIKGDIITPVFKELRNGEHKIISFSAKKARGMMARYIIKNNISDPEQIKNFDLDNYKFNKKLSKDNEFVFVK